MRHDHSNHWQEQQAHDTHAGHSVDMFRTRFWISLVLTLPIVLYSPMIQEWFAFQPPQFPGADMVPFVLSTVLFFYGGWVFIRGAWGELRRRQPGMMTLIALAISVAYVYSAATQFGLEGEGFFWELATLITIMLLGHWLEMASISRAQSALDAIAKLLPDTAEKLVEGRPQKVMIHELQIGDLILVRPGTRIPVDGVVVEGTSSVDEAAISGESKPVHKTKATNVVAGTINQDGALTIKVSHLGEDTVLAGIMRLVAEAQASKSQVQVLADKAAFILTIIAIITAVLTAITWLVAKDGAFALERSVTVLIVACPHALGLAIPLVVSISTTRAARNGLLVRRRMALESARRLDWVLFDKTGTLTKGEHAVAALWPVASYSKEDILRIAASLEQSSEHIIGKGIVKKAQQERVPLEKVTDFTALPGSGVMGRIQDALYTVASALYLQEKSVDIPKEVRSGTDTGQTVVFVLKENEVIGAIALADEVRPESKPAVEALRKLGVKTAMITGDSEEVAEHVASQLGIDRYFARVRPEDKATQVKALQAGGEKVAMIGDGVNDAPALTQADIGIAIGAGTDVAIKSADIILVKSDPQDVVKIILLSRAAYRKMVQNLWWATGYNIVAIPLAAGVLYGAGILLPPALGAALMSVSTIVVAFNAQLLRRTHI